MWVAELELQDVRNLRRVEVALRPGLNVFHGRNAQGKTSLLEAVGLVARARSFRTEDTPAVIRRGAAAAEVRAAVVDAAAEHRRLGVRVESAGRRLSVDGRTVPPRDYYGRLEVAVYSTERLRVVRGGMRERRLFVDRAAGALWPSYRKLARDFERVLRQRNAALEHASADLSGWTERFVELGAELRQRRSDYVRRLAEQLEHGYRPEGERYAIACDPERGPDARDAHRSALAGELDALAGRERHAQRSLAGPHRDALAFRVDGADTDAASSGQTRSLLLALTLASLEVYRAETGTDAVALLDDLDSELDAGRARELCRQVARRGQALVTTAHREWIERLDEAAVFEVEGGEVRAA